MTGTVYFRVSGGRPTGEYAQIYVCPVCDQPTYFDTDGTQRPALRYGATLNKVPSDGLRELYDEARDCTAAGAHTAAVMLSRKILMNLAVREGAPEGKTFQAYVDYLASNGYVPPKGKTWVDSIRDLGNEANHEIKPMGQDDSKRILHLVEMLLRFNFELHSTTDAPNT